MSLHGSVTLSWADGEHTFRLALGQIRELEENRNIGIYALLMRIQAGAWYVDDLREVIRLGLIGSETKTAMDALALVIRYVDQQPLTDSVAPAIAILAAAIFSSDDDTVGKKKEHPQTVRKSRKS